MQDPTPRLNPYAFSAETETRLLLLTVTLCLLTVQIGFVLADRLGLPSPADIETLVATASQMPPLGTAATPGGELAYRMFLVANLKLLGQLLLVPAPPAALPGLRQPIGATPGDWLSL